MVESRLLLALERIEVLERQAEAGHQTVEALTQQLQALTVRVGELEVRSQATGSPTQSTHVQNLARRVHRLENYSTYIS